MTDNYMKFSPEVLKKIGRGEGLFFYSLLSQLNNHSLIRKYKEKKWVENTYEQWGKMLGYSKRQISRIIANLKEKEIILVEKFRSSQGKLTIFYSLNYEKVPVLLNEITDATNQALEKENLNVSF